MSPEPPAPAFTLALKQWHAPPASVFAGTIKVRGSAALEKAMLRAVREEVGAEQLIVHLDNRVSNELHLAYYGGSEAIRQLQDQLHNAISADGFHIQAQPEPQGGS
jgi:hypothetical protein